VALAGSALAGSALLYLDLQHARDGQPAHGAGAGAAQERLGAFCAHAEVPAGKHGGVLAVG
jgi:hypothetical protein